jgi:hypothetical protein
MRGKGRLLARVLGCSLITLGCAAAAFADEAMDLAKRRQNPIPDLSSLSFDNGSNFGAGSHHRVQNELDVRPLVPFRPTEDWYFVTRTIAPVLRQPHEDSPAGEIWGLGDITFTGFLAPVKVSAVTWGVGPVVTLPTATHDALGSRKWGLGPSAAAVVSPGDWVISALAQNVWSVAGNKDRPDVSQFLLQYSVSYNFPDGWYLTSGPTITADWKAEAARRWVVPVGGGFGKVVTLGRQPMTLETQAFYNLERGADAGNWSLSLLLQLLFPQGGGL